MTAHTVCEPKSFSSVLQQPSRKKPVIGLNEQGSSGPPSTLRAPPPPFQPRSMSGSPRCADEKRNPQRAPRKLRTLRA
ncbi:hypothetical protein [Methyloversatilis sp.]|uniref:hypothetical protein n=1 Tax=Methyloversatilis sp. TaxID=2569862 RepID=UPI003D29C898